MKMATSPGIAQPLDTRSGPKVTILGWIVRQDVVPHAGKLYGEIVELISDSLGSVCGVGSE